MCLSEMGVDMRSIYMYVTGLVVYVLHNMICYKYDPTQLESSSQSKFKFKTIIKKKIIIND